MPDFGIEAFTDDDGGYRGSTFREVVDAINANPYQRVWGRENEPPLPVYEVTLHNLLRGILTPGSPGLFRKATERAVDSQAGLRWGPDRKGFRRVRSPGRKATHRARHPAIPGRFGGSDAKTDQLRNPVS